MSQGFLVLFTGSFQHLCQMLSDVFNTNCYKPFLTYWSWLWFIPFTWSGNTAHDKCDRLTLGILTPPRHLIPPLIYSKVRVRPFSVLYFLQDLCDWWLFVVYAISVQHVLLTRRNSCQLIGRSSHTNFDYASMVEWSRHQSYHETSHLQPAPVRILLVPMLLCKKGFQFTCGRSMVSPHIHYIMYLGFLVHQ
jgi:hypothetical protein